MAVDYISLLDSIKNLLDKNNTNTSAYDISANLTKRIKNVYKGIDKSAEKNRIPNIQYPCIYVEAVGDNRDFQQLGKGSTRMSEIQFNIKPMFQTGVTRYTSDEEVIIATYNIETLFDNYTNISNTCSWALIDNVDFALVEDNDMWNSVGLVSLKVNKLTS